MRSDLAARVARLANQLSRQERLVVMLRYAEELTVVETAAVLDLAPGAVRRI